MDWAAGPVVKTPPSTPWNVHVEPRFPFELMCETERELSTRGRKHQQVRSGHEWMVGNVRISTVVPSLGKNSVYCPSAAPTKLTVVSSTIWRARTVGEAVAAEARTARAAAAESFIVAVVFARESLMEGAVLLFESGDEL